MRRGRERCLVAEGEGKQRRVREWEAGAFGSCQMSLAWPVRSRAVGIRRSVLAKDFAADIETRCSLGLERGLAD